MLIRIHLNTLKYGISLNNIITIPHYGVVIVGK